MIQLSDTKAASVPGALLGQKPKAGGDASAFAFALGSLSADGAPGIAIARARQPLAETGSDLPDEPAEQPMSDVAAVPTLEMPAAPPIAIATDRVTMAAPSDPSSATPVVPPQIIPAGSAIPRAVPANVSPPIVPGVVHPVATVPSEKRVVVGIDAPLQPAAPQAIATTPAGPTLPAPPRDDSPAATVTPPVIASSPAPATVAAPATSPEARPDPATLPMVTAARTAVPTPLSGQAATAPTPPVTAQPLAATALPSAVAVEPKNVTAPAARPALAVRFDAAPARKTPDAAIAVGKSPAGQPRPVASPAIQPTATAHASAQPARFVVTDRAAEARPDHPAPRRIVVAPIVVPAATATAMPMIAADLIPAEHRPRIATTATVPVVDPASIGLSAPVEAPSRIAEPAPIDTGRADWIEGMIEQIDVLREAHAEGTGETTTRIRLSPDALGGIEIMLTGEGEAIDVRIHADTAAARTMLAEAAPRLTDMAEARGLKLAQGDAGQSGQHQAQRQQQPDQPAANRRHAADSDRTAHDLHERIA